MKKQLYLCILLVLGMNVSFGQSQSFNCEEDTVLQTKFIVGSSKYLVNKPKATSILTTYAQNGCIAAQLKLAEVYSTTKHGIFDSEKACYFAQMAMNSGSEKGKELFIKFYKKQIGCQLNEDDFLNLLPCNEKTDRAYKLFKGSNVIVAEEVKAFARLAKYADQGCVEAQYLVGKYAKKGFRDVIEIDYQKSFHYLTLAVDQGHPRAHSHLGQLYERGYACDLNFDKALELFETGYELGDAMGAYCIGYDYLRGMGNVEQSYDKAIEWFEKGSNYQMAIHWLAIMNYFGFGMPVDQDKAIELLINNEGMYNSPRLLEHLELHKDDPDTILGNFTEMDIESETEEINTILEAQTEGVEEQTEVTIEHLIGDWKGKLVELDFAGERILREFPIDINFTQHQEQDKTYYTTNIDSIAYQGEGLLLDREFYFNDLTVSLPKLYKDNLTEKLSLKVTSANLELKELNHIEYLTAFIESKELNWNEKGTPMLLILTNDQVITDNNITISHEIINELLNAQGDSFITLYPNPFKTDLLIQYNLATEAHTSVELYSLQGSFYRKVADHQLQAAGEKIYHIDGSNLDSGYYVVKVTVGQVEKTKLIIKE